MSQCPRCGRNWPWDGSWQQDNRCFGCGWIPGQEKWQQKTSPEQDRTPSASSASDADSGLVTIGIVVAIIAACIFPGIIVLYGIIGVVVLLVHLDSTPSTTKKATCFRSTGNSTQSRFVASKKRSDPVKNTNGAIDRVRSGRSRRASSSPIRPGDEIHALVNGKWVPARLVAKRRNGQHVVQLDGGESVLTLTIRTDL